MSEGLGAVVLVIAETVTVRAVVVAAVEAKEGSQELAASKSAASSSGMARFRMAPKDSNCGCKIDGECPRHLSVMARKLLDGDLPAPL